MRSVRPQPTKNGRNNLMPLNCIISQDGSGRPACCSGWARRAARVLIFIGEGPRGRAGPERVLSRRGLKESAGAVQPFFRSPEKSPMTESFVGGASAAPISMRATAMVASAVVRVARQLFTELERGRRIDATALRNSMDAAFGASDASGAWNWKTAYDACVAAALLFLWRYGAAMRAKAAPPAAMLPLLMRRGPWDAELAKVPEFTESTIHIVAGLQLPSWGRLPNESTRVYRLQTDAGERIVGRKVSATWVANVISCGAPELAPDAAFAALTEGRTILDLAEGLQLRRVRVIGAYRIELSGFTDTMRDRLRACGLFAEIISWKLRMFVPTDASGAQVLAKLLDRYAIERIAEQEVA